MAIIKVYGYAKDGKKFTPDSPEVQREHTKYPTLSLEQVVQGAISDYEAALDAAAAAAIAAAEQNQ